MLVRNKNKVTIPSPNATIEEEEDIIYLASAGYDHTIRFWSPHDGKCSRIIQYPSSQVNDLKISPDKNFLAAAGFLHVRLYNILAMHNNSPEVILEGFVNNVLSIGFHEDSKWLYSGGEDCITRVWDLKTHKNQQQRMFQSKSAANSVKLHTNQVEIFVGQQQGHINIWDIRFNNTTPEVRLPQQHPSIDTGVQCISINPIEEILAAIDNAGCVHIFSPARDLKLFRSWKAHSKYGLKCLFSPNGKYLVTTSADHTAKIWKTCDIMNYDPEVNNHQQDDSCSSSTIQPYQVLTTENQRWVWAAEFSADSQFLVTASSDSVVRLWHVESAEIRREYTGHQKGVTALAFSD